MAKSLILAALAATVLVQPAVAQTETRTIVVRHGDLDLATPAGARSLQHRVWRAVVAVCGTASEVDIEGRNDVRQCRRDTMQVASQRADRVIAGLSRGEPLRVASIRN